MENPMKKNRLAQIREIIKKGGIYDFVKANKLRPLCVICSC